MILIFLVLIALFASLFLLLSDEDPGAPGEDEFTNRYHDTPL